MRRDAVLFAALLGGVSSACGSSGALDRGLPSGSPTTVAIEDVPVKGFPVDVRGPGGERRAAGELLAAEGDCLWVLDQGHVVRVGSEEIDHVTVTMGPSYEDAAALWTALGTASTLSHGFLLVLSAPVWLVGGITVTANESGAHETDAHGRELVQLYQFARYPAGMPVESRGERRAPYRWTR